MTAIIKKELRTYFTQMTGYIFFALMIFFTALYFVLLNVFTRMPNFHQVLDNTTFLFFVMVPTLTMRLFSEEVRNKTDQLLYTSPVKVSHIVLGKYLSACLLFVAAMAVTMLFPLSIARFGELPVNQIVGSYVGFILIGAGFIAVGLFVSVMTDNQIIAAVGTFGVIFIFFVIDGLASGMPATAGASLVFIIMIIAAVTGILYNSTKNVYAALILAVLGLGAAFAVYFINPLLYDGLIIRTLRWLSVFSRYNNLSRGILNVADIVYYITLSMVFIYLTVNIIEKRRWR